MAKKKNTKVEIETSQIEETVVEIPVTEVKLPTEKKKETGKKWEIKPRTYRLKSHKRPLSYMIRGSNVYYFDEEKGHERELKYCQNQKTCFVDEMKGDQRLAHIIFRDGVLHVPKEQTVLQKLLSLYHPHRNRLFYEVDVVKKAETDLDALEIEVEALRAAMELDIDMIESIMRVENGSKVSKMSSKELKRDSLLFAKKNPKLFLELANDNNIQLRNFGIKATEMGILKLSSDQRTFNWGSNDRKLMTVPFDEHPYSALAALFKTDEGMEIYSNIEKRMN